MSAHHPAHHIVSRHLPEAEGTAAGRALHALCRGLRECGIDVRVTSWRDEPPAGEQLPSWCTWVALPTESRARTRARAVRKPRWDAARLPIEHADAERLFADDFESWPAVARAGGILTLHYVTAFDAAAVHARSPKLVQDARAQRAAVRAAELSLTYSPRVAGWAAAQGGRALPTPLALQPPELLPAVRRPIAACVANWDWPPNQAALSSLLAAWMPVREAVPGARLLLAGRGCERVGAITGIRVLGRVDAAADVLAEAAVVAFPCPPSSGPKVKVLEAVMSGRPVVTTPAGVEGLTVGEGAIVTTESGFAAALIEALRAAAEGSERGPRGREIASSVHAPLPAAKARLAALQARLRPALIKKVPTSA